MLLVAGSLKKYDERIEDKEKIEVVKIVSGTTRTYNSAVRSVSYGCKVFLLKSSRNKEKIEVYSVESVF